MLVDRVWRTLQDFFVSNSSLEVREIDVSLNLELVDRNPHNPPVSSFPALDYTFTHCTSPCM